MAEVKTSLDNLAERQLEDRRAIADNERRLNEVRRNEARVDQRLISIERAVTSTDANVQEVLRFIRNGMEGHLP